MCPNEGPLRLAAAAERPQIDPMQIWIDADACPQAVKQILFRAAERTGLSVTLVANRSFRTPPDPRIRSLWVPGGPDAADDRIVELMEAGDLVVTADIPLAARVVAKGGTALDFRGDLYTEDNVRERLALRDLMDELRGEGLRTGGPAPFGEADKRAFANALDRLLTQRRD
jgi:uncharacterized protein YaiI (UPF0178 family)